MDYFELATLVFGLFLLVCLVWGCWGYLLLFLLLFSYFILWGFLVLFRSLLLWFIDASLCNQAENITAIMHYLRLFPNFQIISLIILLFDWIITSTLLILNITNIFFNHSNIKLIPIRPNRHFRNPTNPSSTSTLTYLYITINNFYSGCKF